jgi:titin
LQLKLPGEDEWTTVTGEDGTYNLKLTYTLGNRDLLAGEQVQARSRCQNEIGWSEFSLHSYLLMAGVPERPPPPVFVSADATSITLEVLPSRDSNGSPISSYELWRDSGENLEAISIQVADFDGGTTVHQVTGLDPGLLYKFAVYAINAEGTSQSSLYTTMASSELPSKPVAIYKDAVVSNQTQLLVYWDKVANAQIPTSGYILEMAEYGSLDYQVVYNGTNLPQVLSYTVTGLETGSRRSFRLYALNFNGVSEASDVVTFNVCTEPKGM